ncbi:MAG: SDR family oxidoreductase [Pseudomonadota bacterium]
MNEFANKSVLVTGAVGGIGSAVSQLLAQQGASIIATDRDEAALATALNVLPSSGDQTHHLIAGDLANAAFADTLPTQAASVAGRLDVVINNAGLIRRGNIVETSDEDWQVSMLVNVEAVFRICRAAIGIMQQQALDADQARGSIVNVASCWGLSPGPDHLAYCTSKAAVAAMTQCLARDHAGDAIRVNAVCPNEVNTPMLRSGFSKRGLDPDTAIEQLNATVPLGRIAEPEDIADTIAFLASAKARYVCGALLEVNGAKPVA